MKILFLLHNENQLEYFSRFENLHLSSAGEAGRIMKDGVLQLKTVGGTPDHFHTNGATSFVGRVLGC